MKGASWISSSQVFLSQINYTFGNKTIYGMVGKTLYTLFLQYGCDVHMVSLSVAQLSAYLSGRDTVFYLTIR